MGNIVEPESSAMGEMRKLHAEVEAGRPLSPTSEARLISLNDAEDNTTKMNIKVMTMQGGEIVLEVDARATIEDLRT